jgi:Ca2+/Na+ antiporter
MQFLIILMLAKNTASIQHISMSDQGKRLNRDELRRVKNAVIDASNSSEDSIMKQVILVDSGLLAIAAGSVLGDWAHSFSPVIAIFSTIGVGLLFTSLVFAITVLLLSNRLFYSTYRMIEQTLEAEKHMPISESDAYIVEQVEKMQENTPAFPFWASLITLGLGVLMVVIIVFIGVWS